MINLKLVILDKDKGIDISENDKLIIIIENINYIAIEGLKIAIYFINKDRVYAVFKNKKDLNSFINKLY